MLTKALLVMVGALCVACVSQLSTLASSERSGARPVHIATVPPVQEQRTPYYSPDLGLTFPATLAGLAIDSITDWEQKRPGMGQSIAYVSPQVKATIFIYTAGLPQIREGIESSSAQASFIQAMNEIFMAEKWGFLTSASLLESNRVAIASAGKVITLLHAAFQLGEDGTERLSYLYVTGYRNRFVKLRLTYDSLDQDETQQHLSVV